MELQNLHTQVNEVDYEQAVSSFYEPLYGFAYSLSGNENDACELTQETFARLLARSSQLRDWSRVKSWLFTTLYRVFLGWKSRERRLPHVEISSVEHELPSVAAELVDAMDLDTVRAVLLEIDERYRLPLMQTPRASPLRRWSRFQCAPIARAPTPIARPGYLEDRP